MIICIDPGHGGSDPGAGGNGLRECDIALIVALKAKGYLQAVGHSIFMTRETDKDVGYAYDSVVEELQPRCDISNRADSDILVSIHCNAFNSEANGTETFYYAGSDNGRKLAECVQSQIIGLGGLTDRGVKNTSLYMTKHPNAVAILVELAFIDQADDSAKLGDPAWQDDFARAIARGITDYV